MQVSRILWITGVAIAALGLVAFALVRRDAPPASAGALTVEIRNWLGPEVSETVNVFFGARSVGVLKLDAQARTARLRVVLPRAGRHDYVLRTTRRLKGRPRSSDTTAGSIVIDRDDVLGVYSSDAGDTHLLAID